MGDGYSSSPGRASNHVPPHPPVSTPASDSSGADRRLSDAPILLLVLFHNAIRAELEELRGVVVEAAESGGACGGEVVVDLRRRFEFLKTVYKYHCAAEDEVIFLALDIHVKNIAYSYSLEHKTIDNCFESIFGCLNVLLEDGGHASKQLQELRSCVRTIQDFICRHMAKEEQQVFPQLMKQFSDDEQASLVWQFMCSVPIMLLEDLFPWLTRTLSSDEKVDLMHCIRKIVPNDRLLQELVISWLIQKTQRSAGAFVHYVKLARLPDESEVSEDVSRMYSTEGSADKSCQEENDNCSQRNVKDNPLDALHLWHSAIKSDLKEILDNLYLMKQSEEFSTLSSTIVRIKFLADVLIFYSNALDKVFYPVLLDLTPLQPLLFRQSFPEGDEVEGLQQMLYHDWINLPLSKFVDMLCDKVDSLALGISKHLSFQESEVFPLIRKNCTNETQQKLLFTSLHVMPLGLLKCVATWFSSHLPKDALMSMLCCITQSCFLNKSFAALLHEWVRIGYSGKTTVADLQEMFHSRVSCLYEQIGETEPSGKTKRAMIRSSPGTANSWSSNSLKKDLLTHEKLGTLYSSGINLQVFFPKTSSVVPPFSQVPSESRLVDNLEPRPLDHIYYFHKALKKDLELLVLDSAKLSENVGLFVEFHRRFNVLRSLYELHSDTEDNIAFPALEAKQTLENISQSYSIDHELEKQYFDRVSSILDEICEIRNASLCTSMVPLDPQPTRYHQLCLKLQDSCKSLQKMLNDHIHREEIELWPLFRECFSIDEQEWIIGCMLGRTKAKVLQEMILWLKAFLTEEEHHAMMAFWRKATKSTMFDEWLEEWLEGMERCDLAKSEEPKISSDWTADPMAIVLKYSSIENACNGARNVNDKVVTSFPDNFNGTKVDKKKDDLEGSHGKYKTSECRKLHSGSNMKEVESAAATDLVNKKGHPSHATEKIWKQTELSAISQGELEAVIRKVSQDSALDTQAKTRIIQTLLTSRWIAAQHQPDLDDSNPSESGKLPGQVPSHRDPGKSIFGCKHYKQNCKILAPCCNQLFPCRRCHDEVSDHLMDRKSITQMMCMKCLSIQPIGPACSTPCCKLSMGRYYCRICRLFDDEREIYHCPYCNLCRVGKGLGIDYFHCMKCNACMSRSLSVHICREKCFEDKCPICHEDIFTSSNPVKALACGHHMHSTCFQDYTCLHYTCPICSKSLGDMQVYFAMLDALLAEEKIPDEYLGQTQAILCNDCEKKGTAPFHWLYHKCSFCGSYNTRLL